MAGGSSTSSRYQVVTHFADSGRVHIQPAGTDRRRAAKLARMQSHAPANLSRVDVERCETIASFAPSPPKRLNGHKKVNGNHQQLAAQPAIAAAVGERRAS